MKLTSILGALSAALIILAAGAAAARHGPSALRRRESITSTRSRCLQARPDARPSAKRRRPTFS